MAFYDRMFDALGLREWCDASGSGANLSMADLLAQTNATNGENGPAFPFPSLNALNEACPSIPQSRDFVSAVEDGS